LASSYPYTSGSTGVAGTCKYNSSTAIAANTATTPYVTVAYEDVDQMGAALMIKPLSV
jgi:hypothetical protein